MILFRVLRVFPSTPVNRWTQLLCRSSNAGKYSAIRSTQAQGCVIYPIISEIRHEAEGQKQCDGIDGNRHSCRPDRWELENDVSQSYQAANIAGTGRFRMHRLATVDRSVGQVDDNLVCMSLSLMVCMS